MSVVQPSSKYELSYLDKTSTSSRGLFLLTSAAPNTARVKGDGTSFAFHSATSKPVGMCEANSRAVELGVCRRTNF